MHDLDTHVHEQLRVARHLNNKKIKKKLKIICTILTREFVKEICVASTDLCCVATRIYLSSYYYEDTYI